MTQPSLPLTPYRVVDLTVEAGQLCARLLGDMGADVVKVEPPEGDPLRRRGPFWDDDAHPDRSQSFWFYNSNKRGVTLRVDSADGQELLKRLVSSADAVVESYAPGFLDELGLGYEDLRALKPDLVMTSITGWGSTGPYADYEMPDIVGQAMGGLMYPIGDPDRAPLRISFPQTYGYAGSYAAVGTMLALYHRGVTGEGQHVDVSTQQAMVWSLMNATVTWDLYQENTARGGDSMTIGSTGVSIRRNWPCKDGYVTFIIMGGGAGAGIARAIVALVEWMDEEGMAPDYLKVYDFAALDVWSIAQEEMDLLTEPMAEFFLKHTKAELLEGAMQRRVILYPISTPGDLAQNPHLADREFYQPVQHPEMGTSVLYPLPIPRFSATPVSVRRRPPTLGEHNAEVYCDDLGLSRQELGYLRSMGVV